MYVKNKGALIIGMGRSGIAAAEVLLSLGANVSVYDAKTSGQIDPHLIKYFKNRNAICYFGEQPGNIKNFDFAVVSPGVPLSNPLVKKVLEEEVDLLGEVELAYRIGKGNYVAITGTNGKTTTTVLTGEIFKNAGRSAEVVGNVGLAVVKKAVNATDDTWLITEISSFQLETTSRFHPHISALLNLTPDHLDRHINFENYGKAKALIFQNQNEDDYFIVNRDDEKCWDLAKKCRAKVIPFSRSKELSLGTYVKDDYIVINDEKGMTHRICQVSNLGILGVHNLENALAAATIAFFAGIEASSVGKSIEAFEGVAHRLEYVGEVNGVRFINDSKGTNTDASVKAIQAIDSPIILIAGGYDKGSSFSDFIKAFDGKVKALILLGKTAERIKNDAMKQGYTDIIMAKNMEECVREGFAVAGTGDTVLLSPACASWDMYLSFEQRGDHFKTCVRNLEK
ncbi:MAG TPA: UDP-N-acetylmuramoyl-L-alanine--D-glutamate ligase [Anaerovoracaceae bacterium]|nr:UDP-N-acetylmuramoyl-L-alanine--D-glutamate ligase [Anaerovoracaceae bacterium]